MEERISRELKGTQFFGLGKVIFAYNHPNHVFLIEIKNDNNELITVLYDKKHDMLSVNKRLDSNKKTDKTSKRTEVELSDSQKQVIKQLLEKNANE